MEVSFFEMLFVVFIAFLILGPKDLVKYSHLLGRWLGKIRTEVNNFKILAEEEILKDERKKIHELTTLDLAKKNTDTVIDVTPKPDGDPKANG